jgi:hypothetical protein
MLPSIFEDRSHFIISLCKQIMLRLQGELENKYLISPCRQAMHP